MALRDFGQMVYYNIPMCWKCGKPVEAPDPVGRSAVCPACGADLRCCKNCLRYSPGSYHDCAERAEEAPSDKERANFCDWFTLRRDSASGCPADPGKQAEDARAAFDRLFHKTEDLRFSK